MRTQAHKGAAVAGHREKAAVCEPQTQAWRRPALPCMPLALRLPAPGSETVHFCRSSGPLEQTNTRPSLTPHMRSIPSR